MTVRWIKEGFGVYDTPAQGWAVQVNVRNRMDRLQIVAWFAAGLALGFCAAWFIVPMYDTVPPAAPVSAAATAGPTKLTPFERGTLEVQCFQGTSAPAEKACLAAVEALP